MELINVRGLCKSYGRGEKAVCALRGVTLDIEAGETVAIVGASGAGKSTLLNIIGALDRPTSGEVLYGGTRIFDMDDAALAAFRNRTIGFVFQFHHLLTEFTAVENVLLPAIIGGADFGSSRERAEGLLKEVGLSQRLDHRPGELSGGEQQRCAIVRALMQTPQLILADEPTGNLDSKTAEETMELLLRFNREKNITLVVVTHNERLSKRLSRRLVVADGRIVVET